MTLQELTETYSWKNAVELGPQLLSLADELPAIETMGLALQLHQLAIELPAVAAADLMAERPADMTVVLKLIATLELIDRVYPALDASSARRRADDLAGRLNSDGFAERPPAEQPRLESGLPDAAGDTQPDDEQPDKADSGEAKPLVDLSYTPLLMTDVRPAAADADAPAPAAEPPAAPEAESPATTIMPEPPAAPVPDRPAAPDGPDTSFTVPVEPDAGAPSEETNVHPDSRQ